MQVEPVISNQWETAKAINVPPLIGLYYMVQAIGVPHLIGLHYVAKVVDVPALIGNLADWRRKLFPGSFEEVSCYVVRWPHGWELWVTSRS